MYAGGLKGLDSRSDATMSEPCDPEQVKQVRVVRVIHQSAHADGFRR